MGNKNRSSNKGRGDTPKPKHDGNKSNSRGGEITPRPPKPGGKESEDKRKNKH